MRGGWMSHWAPPFYGLTLRPEDKVRIHSDIISLAYHSNGAFTHDEVYTMPIPLRYFYTKWILEQMKKEKAPPENDKTSNKKVISKPF